MPLRVHIIDTESEMETELKSCLHKKREKSSSAQQAMQIMAYSL